MNFNVTYDSSVTSQSQSFQTMFDTAVNAALSFYQSEFANNVTVNIDFAWGATSGNAVAENSFYYQTYSYAQVVSALKASAKSADDIAAYATLPASDPTGSGHSYALTTAQAEALGLSVGYTPPYDDFVTLGSGYAWTFDPNNRAVPGEFDAIGALEHEISEGVFGRVGSLGSASAGFGAGIYTPLDLFRYSASGVHDYSNPGANDYFSIDGTNLLTEFNNHNQFGGDVSDWYPTIRGDSFGDAYYGVAGLVTPTDLRELDILGWNLAQPNTPPTIASSNVVATAGQLFQASSLVNASDTDGDTLTYAFMDATGHGYFDVNGVIQSTNQVFEVPQSQLGQVQFHAGATGTTDIIDANVFDGTVWASPYTQFTVTVPGTANQPPTITSSNVTATAGQVFQASSLLNASDPDGDTLTYAFMDATGNGYFDVNGVVEATNQVFEVPQSQLALVHFHAGAAGTTDTVDANVFDGTVWASPYTQFTVTVPPNQPPTITSSNVTAAAGQVFQASSLLSASDPDGDTLTYAFMDATGNGYFDVNGVVEATNQVFEVPQSQLALVHFHAGAAGTTDTVDANVFDGTVWASPYTQFTVTVPPNQPPTITSSNVTATAGQVFQASSLVSASDPDGDTLTYAFMDATGNGYFDVNGVVEATNQVFEVPQSQLGQVQFHAGATATTDIVDANVFDGTVWGSPYTQFTVTVPHQPPTITSSNVTATAGQVFQASSLVSTSDPAGTPLTYAFMDATGNGYFDVNGVVEATNQVFEVPQSQLALVHFHAGAAGTTDIVDANVFDGTVWVSPYTQFTVNVPNGSMALTTSLKSTAPNSGDRLNSSIDSQVHALVDAIASVNTSGPDPLNSPAGDHFGNWLTSPSPTLTQNARDLHSL